MKDGKSNRARDRELTSTVINQLLEHSSWDHDLIVSGRDWKHRLQKPECLGLKPSSAT